MAVESTKRQSRPRLKNGHIILSDQIKGYVSREHFTLTEVELNTLTEALGQPIRPHEEELARAMQSLAVLVWFETLVPSARGYEELLLSAQASAQQLLTAMTAHKAAPLYKSTLYRLAAMRAGITADQFIDALGVVADLSESLSNNFSDYRDGREWRNEFSKYNYLKHLIYVAHHAQAVLTLPSNEVSAEIDETGNTQLARPLLRFSHAALEIGIQKALSAIKDSSNLPDDKDKALARLSSYRAVSWRSLAESLRAAKKLTARRQREAANFPNLGKTPPIR